MVEASVRAARVWDRGGGGGEARESVRAGTLGHRFTRLPLFYDPAKCRPPPPLCPAPTPRSVVKGRKPRLDSNRRFRKTCRLPQSFATNFVRGGQSSIWTRMDGAGTVFEPRGTRIKGLFLSLSEGREYREVSVLRLQAQVSRPCFTAP